MSPDRHRRQTTFTITHTGQYVETEHEIITLLTSMRDQAPSGFAIALHVRFTTPTYLFLTYPQEWRDIYSSEGYVMSDPTVGWGLTHSGSVTWEQLAKDDPAGMLARAKEFGMNFGVCIATDEGDSQSLCSFTRPDRNFDEDEVSHLTEGFLALHRMTADLSSLSPETSTALQRMSMAVTHP